MGASGSYLSDPRERINIAQYSLKKKKLIGEGRYGYVWMAKDELSKKRMALKQIAAQDQEQMALARQEAELMRAVSPHPNLIEFFGDCAVKVGDGYAYYILMELCTVQLSQLMAQRNSLPWNDSEVVHIFSQVCVGVQRLHHNSPLPIAHRDIKAENVLADGCGRFKLADFGSATTSLGVCESAKERAQLEDQIQRLTTLQYRAPEMVSAPL